MKLNEEEKKYLKDVIDECIEEDWTVRLQRLRTLKELKLLWDGVSHYYWSAIAHDWRIPRENADDSQYDYSVNIFRAYLESIIAALSVTIPPVKCYPDDAENTLDLTTAKAGDKIAQLLYRHNKVNLKWLRGLFIYATEGPVYCYTYSHSDESYGTIKESKYEDIVETHSYVTCPQCFAQIEDLILDNEKVEEPIVEDETEDYCPSCGELVTPVRQTETMNISKLIESINKPKSRQCMDIYGGLSVKTPIYSKEIKDFPYLILRNDYHYTTLRAKYNKIDPEKIVGIADSDEFNERDARQSTQYIGADINRDLATETKIWLRPSRLESIPDKSIRKKFKDFFKKGAYVVLVNDHIVEIKNESMDSCWTCTENPLTDYHQHDALGMLLTSFQEIIETIVSLIIQTVEHGIPQTMADPGVLNFNAYRNSRAQPGDIIPATPKSGKALNDSFYTVKSATLSDEVMPFAQWSQSLGQIVSGALPSLFGGAAEGSKTASEYNMSRSQALQRQQNTWKIFIEWWKQIFQKMIPAYIQEMQADEKWVERDYHGGFINVLIRTAELEGKIGSVELDISDNLPMTWMQQKDTIMQLIQLNNPQLIEFLFRPENLPKIREAIGLTDIYIPGEDDRNKQYEEIKLLLDAEPIPDVDEATGQEVENPSVEVDPLHDNHEIEYQICRSWITSEAGRDAKIHNDVGYKNVLLHARDHQLAMIEAAMNAANMPQDPNAAQPPIEQGQPNVSQQA